MNDYAFTRGHRASGETLHDAAGCHGILVLYSSLSDTLAV